MIQKIVVVEDDPDIQLLIENGLSRSDYRVMFADDGYTGLKLIRQHTPNIIVLDVMVPQINGFELCRRIKSDRTLEQIPIIFLTAKSDEHDVLLGLNMGADDYITKPFSVKELRARISAVSKRGPLVDDIAESMLEFGDLRIDPLGYEVIVGNTSVTLTATEFRLLECLARNPNRVFTRDQLLNNSISENAFVIDRNIDVHIRGIRKKLGPKSKLIQTVRGVGYRFSWRAERSPA